MITVVLFAGNLAIAGTVTFENVSPPAFYGYTTYTQNGVSLYTDAMWIEGPAGNNCGGGGCLLNGTNVGVIYRAWLTTGSVFNLNSLDYSQSFPGGYTTLYFVGDIAGGGTYTLTLNLDAANGFQTVNPNWTNLTSVFMYGEGGLGANWSYFTLDNINVTTQTPEPGTLALLGAGLLGVGGVVRRRKRR